MTNVYRAMTNGYQVFMTSQSYYVAWSSNLRENYVDAKVINYFDLQVMS